MAHRNPGLSQEDRINRIWELLQILTNISYRYFQVEQINQAVETDRINFINQTGSDLGFGMHGSNSAMSEMTANMTGYNPGSQETKEAKREGTGSVAGILKHFCFREERYSQVMPYPQDVTNTVRSVILHPDVAHLRANPVRSVVLHPDVARLQLNTDRRVTLFRPVGEQTTDVHQVTKRDKLFSR